jgi:hypothetical protein
MPTMKRAIIVAAGDVDGLPEEVQAVANEFNGAGWAVRLLLGNEASRAGLLAAADKRRFDFAWLGMHSGSAGFGLTDGVMPAAELGQFLGHIGASNAVLNSCFSAEHVTAIQRAAPSLAITATIDPAGVATDQAWTTGVYLARDFIESGDLQAATAAASGFGAIQYRYFPAVGRAKRRNMQGDNEDIVRQLTEALAGSTLTGEPGLFVRLNRLATQLEGFIAEQQKTNNAQQQTNAETAARLKLLEQRQPLQMSSREAAGTIFLVLTIALLVLYLAARFGGIVQ